MVVATKEQDKDHLGLLLPTVQILLLVKKVISFVAKKKGKGG